jgi:esterase/lipase superfamily enzyme
VDADSWYCRVEHPADRVRYHARCDRYLHDAVLPLTRCDVWRVLSVWDGWAHDWPYWREMIRTEVGGHD